MNDIFKIKKEPKHPIKYVTINNRHLEGGYFFNNRGKKSLHSIATEIFFNEEFWKKSPFKVSIICGHVLKILVIHNFNWVFKLIRKVMLSILFIGFINHIYSSNIDSLINRVSLSKGEEKIDVLSQLCWELKYADQKEAIIYGLQGLELARELSFPEKEAKLLENLAIVHLIKSDYLLAKDYAASAINLYQKQENAIGIAKVSNITGLIHSNTGAYEEAIFEFEKAVSLFKILQDTVKIISVEANIGNVYYQKGEYLKTLPYYHRIVNYAREKKDQEKLSLNLYNLGIVFVKLGDYPKALDYLYENLSISESLGSHFHTIKAQNEIGIVFRRLELFDEAIELYERTIQTATELENQNLLASLYNNLGLCYFRKELFQPALENFHHTLEIRQSLGVENIGHILNNIGSVHHERGNYAQALNFYMQAIEINTELDLKHKLAIDWSDLGKLYLEQGNYSEAEIYLTKAFRVLENTKTLKELSNILELLYTLHEKKGKKQEAITFRKLHKDYQDSLFNSQKLLASHRIIVREQLKKKSEELKLSKQSLVQLENQQKLIHKKNKFLIFGATLILICLITFFIFQIKKSQKRRKNLAKSLETVQSEKINLKASLHEQQREMMQFSLDMIQKETMLNSLQSCLSAQLKIQPHNAELRALMNQLNIREIRNEDWSFFNEVFNKVFPSFTSNIRKSYPNLSRKEVQHCVLIKLNTPPAEAASILGISTESVHTARYRLRKKLNLIRKERLEDVILNF